MKGLRTTEKKRADGTAGQWRYPRPGAKKANPASLPTGVEGAHGVLPRELGEDALSSQLAETRSTVVVGEERIDVAGEGFDVARRRVGRSLAGSSAGLGEIKRNDRAFHRHVFGDLHHRR